MKSAALLLVQADNAAERANTFRKRARRAYRDLKFQLVLGWFLWAGVAVNLVTMIPSVLGQQWVMLGINVATATAALFVRLKVVPKIKVNLRKIAESNDVDAEQLVHAAENYMAAYESAKWTEEFKALLPKPEYVSSTQAQRDRQLYGDVYGYGVHAERELEYRKALYRAAVEEASQPRIERSAERQPGGAWGAEWSSTPEVNDGTERYETIEGDDGAWYRVTTSDAAIIRAQRARERLEKAGAKRARAEKPLDLTDWQGDADPRRIWADTLCNHCGEEMGNSNHTHDQYGRRRL